MLRGPRTPGELKARSERLHPFDGLEGIHAGVERLAEGELVARLRRRPGQKEERYAHRLSEDREEEGEAPAPEPESFEARVARLEREVAELRGELGA